MSLYAKFAAVYHRGPYPTFALRMAELLPALLIRFDAHPTRLLDIACGEGSFAAAMARRGMQVTGLDRSEQMLDFARQRSADERLDIHWVPGDMTTLDFPPTFDLVTCWFDSLNYVMELADLEKVFSGVHHALLPDGLFIFDMNTLYGLAVGWTRQTTYVQQDFEDLLELHCTQFDYDRSIARVHVTVFERQDETWTRFDEEHLERGYPVEQIQVSLEAVGLQVLGMFGNITELTGVKDDTGRVWLVVQKPGSMEPIM
jgi:SAM-dependent methyltransferase